MKILQISKYPPIQGGVSAQCFWLSRLLVQLGHEVTVLTNADEVEDEYRVEWNAEDDSFLSVAADNGGPAIHSTKTERQHYYIPQGNPVVTKLVSKGLEIISKFQPDVIYSRYFEPYGIAGSILSMQTGIGHAVAHAGSDVGRLMTSTQLRSAYEMVLNNARAVVTNRAKDLGVPETKAVPGIPNWLPSHIFYPRASQHREVFRFGIYGKIGRHKGTMELLHAASRLLQQGVKLEVHAAWGGRGIENVHQKVEELGLKESFILRHFIPHWRVPNFIWDCDAILFLENGFPIIEHSPQVPLESIICGRPVLTTREIAEKRLYKNLAGKECFHLIDEPFAVETLEEGMLRMMNVAKFFSGKIMNWIDSKEREENSLWTTAKHFERIFQLCAG